MGAASGEESFANETAGLVPDEATRAAQQQLEAALASDVRERVIAAPPDLFERANVKLPLAMGYGGAAADRRGQGGRVERAASMG